MMIVKTIVIGVILNMTLSQIVKLFFTKNNDVIDKITPIDMVIIPDMHIEKYLPNINSFLAIGNVRMVSRVPRSFSPAVLSVEAQILDSVIAIIVKVIAIKTTSLANIDSPFNSFVVQLMLLYTLLISMLFSNK